MPYEFVVVDNGDDPRNVDDVAARHDATVVRAANNLGYGGGANVGAENFSGEWILVANPDLVFEAGAIDAMVRTAEEWPRGGVFGPLMKTVEGEVYPSARQFPRLVSGVGHALLTGIWPSNPFSQAYHANASIAQAHPVDWLSGACLLIRTQAFRDVGGFDESYFMFFEDTQLGEDMVAHGWSSVFVPEGVVIHEQGKSWKDRPAHMLRAHHRSAAHYLDKVYSSPVQLPIRVILRWALWVRGELQIWRSGRS